MTAAAIAEDIVDPAISASHIKRLLRRNERFGRDKNSSKSNASHEASLFVTGIMPANRKAPNGKSEILS